MNDKMNKEPRISIIIPSYNWASLKYQNKHLIDICLNALKKTVYKNYTIIITDDNSNDNTINYLTTNYLHEKQSNIILIKNKRNGGFCKNSNSGIKYAIKKLNPKYMVLFNDDILIKDIYWLSKMVKIAEKNNKIGAIGCKLLYPNFRIQSTEYNVNSVPRYIGRSEIDKGQYNYIRQTTGVNGALMFLRKEAVEKIGLLDENYYMGFDDADYSIRLRKAGYKLIYDGKIEAIHMESASTTKEISDKRFYLVQVGYIYFAFKHLNKFQILNAIIHELAGAIFTIDKENKKRGIKNIRLRKKVLWRFIISIKAIKEGYKLYKINKSWKNA